MIRNWEALQQNYFKMAATYCTFAAWDSSLKDMRTRKINNKFST